MEYEKGEIIYYNDKKAKIIGAAIKGGKTKYKLRLYDNTIVTNIDSKEISRRI